jgi:preprotein translocase subunit SecG
VTEQFAFDLTAVGTLTIKGIYTLTINYVDTTGRTLAASHVERLVEGAAFEPIVSPTIAGYTPNFASVSSPASGMPNRDVSVDVVYTANATTTPATTTPAANNTLVPAAPVQVADNANAIDNTTIEDEDVPEGVLSFDENGNPEIVDIEDEATALASGAEGAAWALINLIAAILTAVICILLLISLFKRKKDEEEDEKKQTSEEDDEDEKRKKQRVLVKVLGIVPAVASVIAFILTENMKNPMRWVDRWTILMIILLVIEILMACFSSKKEKVEKEEEETA